MLSLLAAQPALAAGLALVLGLLIGSFLNVVILRLPPRLEWQWRRDAREFLELPEQYDPAPPGIVVQRSACPKCGHRLAPWENVPLLSFVLLKLIDLTIGLRVTEEEEREGLDVVLHGEHVE